jgi:hypothetical protein
MRESGAATGPSGGLLSADLQRILFNAEERRVFLDEFRAHVSPRTYQMIENRITTLQRLCERLLEPDATMNDLRRISAEGDAGLEER